jgi:hypothetical protein
MRDHFTRDLSRTDQQRISHLIGEVHRGERAGYTYTGNFKFDIDDPRSMAHTYDKLGPHVMFAIAETNRPMEDFYISNSTISKLTGVAMWRDDKGRVYVDDVRLHVDIDDEEALRIARQYDQFIILKVDGRTRSFAFLEGPGYDVKIGGQGHERTFEPRPEP